MSTDDGCRGCQRVVRLAPGEIERILADILRDQPAGAVVDDRTYQSRVLTCDGCDDLRYGTTCKYCGCLVAVRAKLSEKACPAPAPKWRAIAPASQQ